MEALEQTVAEIDKDRQPIFERFTQASHNAVFNARLEALRRGDRTINVADLLSGLSWAEISRANRVGFLKDNAFYLRWLSGLPALPMSSPSVTGHDLQNATHLDPEVKKALAFAVAEADRDREYWIDSDHLLRGLLRFPNQADFALLKTELTLSVARTNSSRDREEFLPQENPSLKVIRYLIRKHLALWGPPIVSLLCYLYILVQSMGMQLTPLAH